MLAIGALYYFFVHRHMKSAPAAGAAEPPRDRP